MTDQNKRLAKSWPKNKSGRNRFEVSRSEFRGQDMILIEDLFENEKGETKRRQMIGLRTIHIPNLISALKRARMLPRVERGN